MKKKIKLDFEKYMKENSISDDDDFIDRDLSWLDFNDRILKCGAGEKTPVPLNEQLNYLGFASNNLDEFISVRFASFLNDKEERQALIKGIKKDLDKQKKLFKKLRNELWKHKIKISKVDSLSKDEEKELYNIYRKRIYPLVTPINLNINRIPIIETGQNCIMALINNDDGKQYLNVIPISKHLDDIVIINNKVLLIEDVIIRYLGDIFVNKEIADTTVFRIHRDCNIPLNHDEGTFINDRMDELVNMRKFSTPIFMEIDSNVSKRLRLLLIRVFNIKKDAIYDDSKILSYKRFMKYKLLSEENSYKKFTPNVFESEGEYENIYEAISDKELLLHHPYDSYDTVVNFIEKSAIDPDVISIRQTPYRVSSESSPIVNALCRAAQNGKDVSVLVEVKARFDESRNINLINKLNNAGVNVIFGYEYLKTHCKFCIVSRMEDGAVKYYTHIATGNYNEKTSKIYTDLSYLTADEDIGDDVSALFNILSGISNPNEKLNKILYSPITLRDKIYKLIDNEISAVKHKKKGMIVLKLNSLSDPEMIKKLYKAAKEGVEIYIICRGICSILPKKNIHIKSIVGRFLEHSRIYYFRNGGNPKYYISSADLLTRNLDRRVEIMVQIKGKSLESQLMHILEIFMSDERNSFSMNNKGKYEKKNGDFDAHQWFIDEAENKIKIKLPSNKMKKILK